MSDDTSQAQSTPSDENVNLDAPETTQEGKPEGTKPEGAEKQDAASTDQQGESQQEGEGGDGSAEDADRPSKKTGYQRLKARAERLERENAELRARGGSSATDDAGIKSEVEKRIGAPPKQEDFADVFAFEREATAYSAARRLAEVQVRQESETAKAAHQAARREVFEDHLDRVNEAKKELKDYDEVVSKAAAQRLEARPDIEDLIVSSEDSGRLLYHLMKNPALVNELNSLPPIQAAKRIGAIENGLQRSAQAKTTKAPAPLQSPKGGANNNRAPEEIDNMDDYAAARRKQGFGRWKGDR